MPHRQLPILIDKLKTEIRNLENNNDAEIKNLVSELENTLTALLDKIDQHKGSELEESPLNAALAIEAHFSSHHPVAAKLVREIIDTLNKMGI